MLNLRAVFLRGSDIIVCPSSNRGTHRQRRRRKTAPVAVKIEGAKRGKEGWTAPAAITTEPDQPAGLAGDACCKCGHQSSCKTARCGCRRAGRNCVSYQCLVRCANVAPQTRQDKQRTTQEKTGDGAGRRRGKRRQGQGRGADAKTKAGETQDAATTANATTKAGETQDAGRTEHAVRPSKLLGTEASARRRVVADVTE